MTFFRTDWLGRKSVRHLGHMLTLALVLCHICDAADELHNSNWPRLRGPLAAGQGGSQTFPHAWSGSDWAWSVELPGTGHGSPTIWQGRIYTASARAGADAAGGLRCVSCHALADGKLLWQAELPGPLERHHAQNSSASATVAVDELGVYWTWATDEGLRVEAFDHEGRRLWHAEPGAFVTEHGFGGSPAVWRELVIVPMEQDGPSCVVALDRRTGQERWRLPRDLARTNYSTPLVIEGAEPLVILASMAHGISGIDPATGKVRWERRCLPKRSVSCPVVVAGLAIATCGDGGGDNALLAVRLPAAGAPAGTEPEIAYTIDRSAAPYVPTPLASGGRLYLWGDRGVVTCLDAASGEVRWKGRVGGNFSASPVAVGGTVLNVSADGEVVVLADGDALEVLGRTPLGEECRATPAVVEGRMIFRTAGRLHALDSSPPQK